MARAADEEMIGRKVAGKFVVEKFLGGGAMGAVYKAYQASLEKHVAIKVLHKEFGNEPTFVSRFEREAKAASLLDHPNLMRVVDYGREPDGVCYIAMELLEGRTLFQVIKEDGPLTNERIATLLRQTLAGLAVAHEMGIVHRDLKPENIIVLEKRDDDGQRAEVAKVCDFGMAKLVTPDHEAAGPLSSEKLTSHGVVVGTPDYMSPEQGRGERLDARSDLYAVGVILYQMLTGRLPFSAETPIATLLRHVIDEPEPPSEIDPNIHSGLESICLRALAKRPRDRFQTAREMRAEIRAVTEARAGSHPSALPPAPGQSASYPDGSVGAIDLRAPLAPRRLEAAPVAAQSGSSPNSSRIRAVEVLREEAKRPRKWVAPLAVLAVSAVAAGTFLGMKHRHAPAISHPIAAAQTPHDPAVDPAVAPASPVASTGASAPLPPPTGDLEPTRPPIADARAVGAPTFASSSGGVALERGGAKGEPTGSASAAQSSAPSSAPRPTFGVLAVPELPQIAGASPATPPAPPAPPPEAPAAAPSAPAAADPFAHARVSVGAVHVEKVATSDIVAALPSSRFERCYRKALAARGSAVGGSGSLHLAIDSVGHVGSASFAGTPDLASIGQCIADAAIGSNVKHVEAGATAADIDLTFQAE